jgi:hypothetical protein
VESSIAETGITILEDSITCPENESDLILEESIKLLFDEEEFRQSPGFLE